MRTLLRVSLPVLTAAFLIGAGFSAPSVSAAPAAACTGQLCRVSFALTGAPVTWTVPAGVTSISVTLAAGSGGIGHPDPAPAKPGGAGGLVAATVPVTPGQVLTVVVGGKGDDGITDPNFDPTGPDAEGGYGGGGTNVHVVGGTDGAGGGGSFLFRGSAVLLAAGGGGGGGYSPGGTGGAGGAGGKAGAGTTGNPAGVGGGGATTTGPGAGGASNNGLPNGQPGTGPAAGPATFGHGGNSQQTNVAGSGGGGFYGGGAGGMQVMVSPAVIYGGGGGGSGFVATGVRTTATGTNVGNGSAVIEYVLKRKTSTSVSAAPNPATTHTSVTLTAQVAVIGGGVATGTVTFFDGNTRLASARLTNGTATVTVPAGSTARTRNITARYGGDPLRLASASARTRLVITAPATAAGGGTQLANTGASDTGALSGLGALLVVLGSFALLLGRRRRV